jgi:hypothetical protein
MPNQTSTGLYMSEIGSSSAKQPVEKVPKAGFASTGFPVNQAASIAGKMSFLTGSKGYAKRVAVILTVTALVSLFIAFMFGMQGSKRAIDQFFTIPPDAVEWIALRPLPSPRLTPLAAPIVVTEPDKIKKALATIRQSTPVLANHPLQEWQCQIEIATSSGSSFGTISATSNEGVLLYVHSGATDGWHYGEYRNDALADLINAVGQ